MTTITNNRLLLFSLNVAPFIPSIGLANGDGFSKQEDTGPSFYGQRSVFVSDAKADQPTFQQRVIAPPIDKLTMAAQLEELEEELAKQPPKAAIHSVTLSRNEKLLAKKSAHYFKRNWREQTGLWDSVQGYPYTTMWDIASGIGATLAMEALDMETTEQTKRTLSKTLESLKALKLYKNRLPNREYSSKTAKPAGKYSTSKSNGNGWSALDIGRLLIWLKIVAQYHPDLSPVIEEITEKWKLEEAVYNGTLFGTKLTSKKEYYRQEGRHGYLEYASHGFSLYGFEVDHPKLPHYLEKVLIEDIEVTIDSRNVPFLTSDPLVLAAIEFGENEEWNQVKTFYELHQREWEESGELTAYAEDSMNRSPWFAYNNIYYAGRPWSSVTPAGKRVDNPQTFSNKVAIAFSVLFDSPYSDELFEHVLQSSLHYRSIPTGTYEDGGLNTAFNSNTNSLILVALWYKKRGNRPILDLDFKLADHSTLSITKH